MDRRCFEFMQSSMIRSRCFSGKRRARFMRNFSTRIGMPSFRRRLWPMGYSTTISFSFFPSVNSTVRAFAIERFAGSW